MLPPLIKKGTELTAQEIEQLYQLHMKYAVDASPEAAHHHIIERHVERMEVTFYLYKWKGRIVAYHASTWFERTTPFHKKPLPIFHVNMTFKEEGANEHIKNYAKFSNLHLLRQQLGRFWYLKPFVMTFLTVNPKIIARLSKVFSQTYPTGNAPTPAIAAFAQQHLAEDLKINPDKISPQLVLQDQSQPWIYIHQQWESSFQSTSEPINQFFLEQGIFKQEAGEYWMRVDNFALFIGYCHPLGLLSGEIRSLLKWSN